VRVLQRTQHVVEPLSQVGRHMGAVERNPMTIVVSGGGPADQDRVRDQLLETGVRVQHRCPLRLGYVVWPRRHEQ